MKRLFPFHIAIAITAFILPLSASAKYLPASFLDLVGTSEKIAVGTFTKIEKETAALKVEDLIAGPGIVGETITIRQFRDWPCAWRWSAYEVGQKVLVFLNFNADAAEWVIRGAGGEGESPVVGDAVYANFRVPGKVVEYGSNRFRKRYFVEVPYAQLRSAVLDFRKSFRVTRAQHPWRKDGENSVFVPFDRIQRITEPRISPFRPRTPPTTFRNRSALHRYLEDTVEEELKKMEKYNSS